jgi:phospholipase/lecithinase/hemolysin
MKSNINRRTNCFRKATLSATASLALLIGLATAQADSTAFSRLFVFGDSLSDTGNLYAMTGDYPAPPFWNGRFSNGKLWVEYLADSLQMPIRPEDNYAVAGATTGRLNANNGRGGRNYAGLQDEIDAFQTAHTQADSVDALFVVWAGANDFFAAISLGVPPQVLVSNGVYNTSMAIVRLKQSGAQHILVPNVPDLGVTPYVRGLGMGPQVSALCAAYNQVLAAALDNLAASGAPVIRVDAFSTLRDMALQPSEYGFTNSTDSVLVLGGDPDQFLFWDSVHPTTRGHEVFGHEAGRALVDWFSPSHGNLDAPGVINSLRGLLQAAGH